MQVSKDAQALQALKGTPPQFVGPVETLWKGRRAQWYLNSVTLLTAKVFQLVLGLTNSLAEVPCMPSTLANIA
jgi:hypothetical protein